MSVAVIIPALNEEESIGRVLAAIPADVADEIIVVDGGSSGGTVAVARAGGARVIHEPRRGYGCACAAGVAAAQEDVVVFLDADGADDPGQIPDLLAPILDGQVDLVLGSRLAGEIAPGVPAHVQVRPPPAGRRLGRQHLCLERGFAHLGGIGAGRLCAGPPVCARRQLGLCSLAAPVRRRLWLRG